MKNNIKIYNFEGRYECHGEHFRFFEVSQLKNGGFLISGTKFDIANNKVKPFTTVFKGSKNETTKAFIESLEKVKTFIKAKIERQYIKKGGIETLCHPNYKYPDEIVEKVKNKEIDIVYALDLYPTIETEQNFEKCMSALFD